MDQLRMKKLLTRLQESRLDEIAWRGDQARDVKHKGFREKMRGWVKTHLQRELSKLRLDVGKLQMRVRRRAPPATRHRASGIVRGADVSETVPEKFSFKVLYTPDTVDDLYALLKRVDRKFLLDLEASWARHRWSTEEETPRMVRSRMRSAVHRWLWRMMKEAEDGLNQQFLKDFPNLFPQVVDWDAVKAMGGHPRTGPSPTKPDFRSGAIRIFAHGLGKTADEKASQATVRYGEAEVYVRPWTIYRRGLWTPPGHEPL